MLELNCIDFGHFSDPDLAPGVPGEMDELNWRFFWIMYEQFTNGKCSTSFVETP